MPRLSRNDTALSIQKDHSLIVSRVALNISQAELWMSQYARDPSRSVIGPMNVMRRRPHLRRDKGLPAAALRSDAGGVGAMHCALAGGTSAIRKQPPRGEPSATVGFCRRNACSVENPPTPHQGEAVMVSVASVLSRVKGKPPETF
jgi:hypothetical protein